MVKIMFTFTKKRTSAFYLNVYAYLLKGHICGTLFHMDPDRVIQNSSGCLSSPASIVLNASWEVVSGLGTRKDGKQVQDLHSWVHLLWWKLYKCSPYWGLQSAALQSHPRHWTTASWLRNILSAMFLTLVCTSHNQCIGFCACRLWCPKW